MKNLKKRSYFKLNTFFCLTTIILSPTHVHAQKKERIRYDFANSYIGISSQFLPGTGTTEIIGNIGVEKVDLPPSFQPRLDIGGVHFWGHLDMMGSIPILGNYSYNEDKVKIGGSTGFSMNIRYYPINLIEKTSFGFRPFVGIKWSELKYSQEVDGQEKGIELNKQIVMFETGGGILIKNYLLDLTLQYLPKHNYEYPISRTAFGELNYPWLSFKVGLKYLFDFTAVNKKESVKKITNSFHNYLTNNDKHNSWMIGIGFTEVIPVGHSNYKDAPERQFLQNPGPIRIAPEWHLGRYFYKGDWGIRLAGRHAKIEQEGYGFYHELKRNSFTIEGYKFLFDYKGFVPFVGIGYGFNTLQLREWDNKVKVAEFNDNKLAPTIFIGWDIRPTQVEWMIVRSNIRWTPWLSLATGSKEMKFNDLEINFFEYVFYPERLVQKLKFKKTNL